MKSILKTILLILLMSSISLPTFASDPIWSIKFNSSINWKKITPAGIMVVSTNDALYGIDPETGKEIWKIESLSKILEDRYEEIINSPYIAITEVTMAKQEHIILNVLNGSVVCNSKDLGFNTITGRLEIPPLGAMLFFGMNKKSKPMMMLIDMTTGKPRWEREMEKINPIREFPAANIFVVEEDFLFTTSKGIYRINGKSGEIVWEIEQKSPSPVPEMGGPKGTKFTGRYTKTAQIRASNDESRIIFSNQNYLNSFNIKDGSSAWATPVTVDGEITHFSYDTRGALIATGGKKPEINLFDYATGARKWGKDGPKLLGGVVFMSYSDKGLIVSMETAKGKNSITILDFETGNPVINKALKVDGQILNLELANNALFYRTTEEMNFVSIETGTAIGKPTNFKAGSVADYFDQGMYIFAGGVLFNADFKANKIDDFTKGKLKLQGKEVPDQLQVRNGNIMLASSQNIVLFDKNGNELANEYYEAPGQSMFAKIAAGVLAVGSMALAMGAAMQAGLNSTTGGGYTDYGRQMKIQQDGWTNIADASFSAMNKRFKATASSQNYITMLTAKANSGGKNGIGLVKVNKDTGKTDKQIVLGTKDPDYEVDEYGNVLYFLPSKNELVCYAF